MIKLAALGALGYAGYKYYQKSAAKSMRSDAPVPQHAIAGRQQRENATNQPEAHHFAN